jgi:hypothetical protein
LPYTSTSTRHICIVNCSTYITVRHIRWTIINVVGFTYCIIVVQTYTFSSICIHHTHLIHIQVCKMGLKVNTKVQSTLNILLHLKLTITNTIQVTLQHHTTTPTTIVHLHIGMISVKKIQYFEIFTAIIQ